MNLTQEQFDAWIAALKENKYKQARRFLYRRMEEGYCCMGVCGLVIGIPKEMMSSVTILTGINLTPGYDAYKAAQAEKAFNDREAHLLATLNDSVGLTFPQIAAFVEAGALDAYRAAPDGELEEIGTLGS